jgi:hypothetical protein
MPNRLDLPILWSFRKGSKSAADENRLLKPCAGLTSLARLLTIRMVALTRPTVQVLPPQALDTSAMGSLNTAFWVL